jgi:anthranilate phosphoribosyltransferase
VAATFRKAGITFAWASLFHPGFGNAARTRGDLGVPTVFNFLGPLCNPARPEASAVGVSNLDRVPLITGVFQTRGATALVFRGDDGLDELSTTGHSHIWEISNGLVTEHDIEPRDLGLPRASIADITGGDPQHNAAVIRRFLDGERGAVRDIVLLNAAAGLIAYQLARDSEQGDTPILKRFRENLEVAAETVDSGKAAAKLEEWVAAAR